MTSEYWLQTRDSVLSTLVHVCSKFVIRVSGHGWEGIRRKKSSCSYTDAVHSYVRKIEF